MAETVANREEAAVSTVEVGGSRRRAPKRPAGDRGERAAASGYTGPAESHRGGPKSARGEPLPKDTLSGITRSRGRIVSVRLPVMIDRNFRRKLEGMTVQEALAALRQRDIDTGDLLRVWETWKAKALGGDKDVLRDYLDRVGGKATQTQVVAQKVVHTVDEDAMRVIDAMKHAFGMATDGKAKARLPAPRELVETTAREVE